MFEILMQNKILATVFIVVVITVTIFLFVKTMQNLGFEKIRLYAYKWFEKAERKFNYGENYEKFDYVVQLARNAIPSPFNLFITEKLLRKTIQLWFNLVKDLLDDGELNGTVEEETEV